MYYCTVTFGMTSSTMYYYTNVLNTLFILTPGDSTNQGSNFAGLNLPVDWFDVGLVQIYERIGILY